MEPTDDTDATTPPALDAILSLDRVGADTFVGTPRTGGAGRRIFGGEVAAQALKAAGTTVDPERHPHSLHLYFLRPGDLTGRLELTVDETRDGGSFSTRRVRVVQHGEVILVLAASFQRPEAPGIAHDDTPHDMPDLAAARTPDDLAEGADDITRRWLARLARSMPLEYRFPEPPALVLAARGEVGPPRQRTWVRVPVDGAPILDRAAGLAYASDMFLLGSALPPHGHHIGDGQLMAASLDHAVWFHAPDRFGEWLLYEQESTWAGGGRALCRGMLRAQDGVPVASVVQEGLVRVADR